MVSEWLADDAHKEFRAKKADLAAKSDANEASIRLHIIDTLLFEILRWDKNVVDPERWVRAVGYSDYVFTPHSVPSLVLEAKREGIEFILPARTYPDEPVPFSLLASECRPAADALIQAQGYANQLGARYSAISNGSQWIFGLTFVPNEGVEERAVYVFESIDAIDQKFRAFYECFSPKAITTNMPTPKLLDRRQAPAPAKLSTKIPNYPVPADRNRLINILRKVLTLVWDEAMFDQDSKVFLEHCYITPESGGDMLHVAKELLEQRRSTDERYVPVASADPATLLKENRKLLKGIEAAEKERPVVLLGRIGTGKSTFLKYLRYVEAKDLLGSQYIQIDIDFLDQPPTAADVPSFVLGQIERQLKKAYMIDIDADSFVRHALRVELRDFQETPRAKHFMDSGRLDDFKDAEIDFIETFTKDRFKYLGYAMRHLKGSQNKSVAIFFDNLDRRPDPIQEYTFLQASAIAAQWSALVFVCLRPSTLQRSQSRGVLDTIAARMLVISPPRTAPMLRKRFQYASKFAQKALPAEVYVRAAFTPETEASLPQASKLFEAWDQSILKKPHLAKQYEAVANGNVRLIVKYVRDTLTSNHLDTERITEKFYSAGEYELSEQETLRALIYGPFIHFDPNTSVFINLFDISYVDPAEHFSRLLLLEYCHRHANSVDRYGFIPLTAIHTYMSDIGFSGTHIDEVVKALFSKKCIESRDFDEDAPVLGDEIRITSLGSYHVSFLVRRFIYHDAVVVDTPILNDTIRSKMRDVRLPLERVERVRAFVRYLDDAAESLSHSDARRLWSDISKALVNNVTDVEYEARDEAARAKEKK
jgi:hypothetical protein